MRDTSKKLVWYSRELRRNQTDAEKCLWKNLRDRRLLGYRFRRQVAIGNYIVDFYCFESKLVIELDGGQHNFSENIIKDNERDRYLRAQGLKVVRIWNNDVFKNIEGVLEEIEHHLGAKKPKYPALS